MNTMTETKVLYEKMVLIRLLEDRLQALCDQGEAGDLHFNKGQEAISVGVCAALAPEDHIVTHHRTIAHQIAKGADLHGLVAELLGRTTGTNGGRAGEMHINDRKIRHDFSFQLVGTCIPVAAGLAYALKYHHRSNEIVAVFFGDAATSNGQFHEGLNIAAIKQVPLLLVCENNHLAGNITPEHYTPPAPDFLRTRAYSYGIPHIQTDGNELAEVMRVTALALEVIRRDSRPCMLEFDTTRLCWHKQGQRDVRSADVLATLAERDPLLQFARANDVSDEARDAVYAEMNARLDAVFAEVLQAPFPEVYLD